MTSSVNSGDWCVLRKGRVIHGYGPVIIKPHVASSQPISKHHAIFSSSKNCLEGDTTNILPRLVEKTWGQYGMHQTRRSGRMDVYRSFISTTELSPRRILRFSRRPLRKGQRQGNERKETNSNGKLECKGGVYLVCGIDMIEMAWPFDHGYVVNVSRVQEFLPAQ
jgi:hypothetical protein